MSFDSSKSNKMIDSSDNLNSPLNYEELEEKRNINQETEETKKRRPLRKRKKTLKTEQLDTIELPYFRKGRQDLPLREKIKIIEMLESSPKIPQRMIASTYKVSQSQISRIQNNRDRIMKEWESGNLERKRNRTGKGGMVEQKLLEWYNDAKNESIITSGPILMEKAKAIGEELGLKFTPTSGWFGRWKNRNGITLKGLKNKDGTMSYSKLSSHWKRYTFMKVTKNIDPKNVWFLNTLDLFYNALPDSLINANEDNFNSKKLMLVLAFNLAANNKRNPMVVGAENIAINNLPLSYYTHPESAITRESFYKWLAKWDKELRSEKQKIHLFLGKSSFSSGNCNLFNINLHFFPDGDIESLKLQPFQFGILQTFKNLYRYQIASQHMSYSMCKKLISDSSQNGQLLSSKVPNAINIIDGLFIIKRAWKHVSPDILLKGLVKAGLSKQVQALSVVEDVMPPLGMTKEQFEHYVNIDSFFKGKNISEMTLLNSQASNTSDYQIPNNSEALIACNILKQFLQSKNSVFIDQLAEIESDIQWSLMLQDLPNTESVTKFNPLFNASSIHSIRGHENSLRKRKEIHNIRETSQNESREAQQCHVGQANSTNFYHYSNKPINVNDKLLESNFSNSQEICVPSIANGSVKSFQPILHHQQEHSQITHEYQSPSYIPQGVELKGIPLGVSRTISDINLDRRCAIHADMQHSRPVHDMNTHIIPTTQLASQPPTFIAFTSHF